MKKNNKNTLYIALLLVFIFILDGINFRSMNNEQPFWLDILNFSLINLNIEMWTSMLATILAVFGTYYFTRKSNEQMLVNQREIYEEESEEQKSKWIEEKKILELQVKEEKIANYKNINKQNFVLTKNAILKMYANYMYIYYLKKFEYFICKDYSAINNKTCINIEQINKNLLIKLKAEYFYDKEITNKISELEKINIVTDLNKIPLALADLILEFSISLSELSEVRHMSHRECVKRVYRDFQAPGFNDKYNEYLIFAIYQKQLVTSESSSLNIYNIQTEYKENDYHEILKNELIYVEINESFNNPDYDKEWINSQDFYNLLGKKLSEQTAFMPIPNTSDFAIPYI
ncbi:hypothetical protein R2F61_07155 [Mollicutes bacterium LVI A0078]|nr:hypothetical protein RZE84_07160 [Mollicutes bacterium LVI A0075]WOO90502.1 hypothetical protein R2F61_07155 [Mollicutes bacterium LVI A0078]